MISCRQSSANCKKTKGQLRVESTGKHPPHPVKNAEDFPDQAGVQSYCAGAGAAGALVAGAAGAAGGAGTAGALVTVASDGGAISFFWQPVNRPAQTRPNIATNNRSFFMFRYMTLNLRHQQE
jgi:hypothetical protein